MTIGSLPMACTEIGTEFSTATPFTLGNATLLAAGGFSKPYSVSSWVGKSASETISLTAGEQVLPDSPNAGDTETQTGYLVSTIGSRNPTTFKGQTINGLYKYHVDLSGGGTTNAFEFVLAANVSQNYFSQLTINGHTLTSAAATFIPGASSLWRWATDVGITNTNVYPVVITP